MASGSVSASMSKSLSLAGFERAFAGFGWFPDGNSIAFFAFEPENFFAIVGSLFRAKPSRLPRGRELTLPLLPLRKGAPAAAGRLRALHGRHCRFPLRDDAAHDRGARRSRRAAG